MPVLDLHAAAQHTDEIRDDLAFEDPGIVRLQAVEDLAPDGHDALILRVPAELDAAQGGIALHDINFPLLHILGAAVHEFLDPVGDVNIAGEFFLDIQPLLLRAFPAALVHQHLLGDLLRVEMVLDEINFQIRPQEFRHGLLHELVGDGFFRLVLVTGLGGEVVGDKDQAVLNILPCDLAFIFLIFVLIPQVLIYCGDKSAFCCLFRRAAMLQPGGVVVVLDDLHFVGKAAGGRELHLVFRLIRTVPAPLFRLPEHRSGQSALPGQLRHIVLNAVLVNEILLRQRAVLLLIPELEGNPLIHHRLTAQYIREVFRWNGNIGKHIQIRQPAGAGAGLSHLRLGQRGLFQFAHDLAPLKVELVLKAVPPDGDVHVAGGVLGGAGAQTVEAQRVFIVVTGEVIILAAGVQLTVHQFPVVALFLFVPIHRAAAAHILHLNRAVIVPRHSDDPAVALPGLVDGVGEDLKNRVFAAVQPIGAKNDTGPFPDPVRAFQRRDAVIAIILFFSHHSSSKRAFPRLSGNILPFSY